MTTSRWTGIAELHTCYANTASGLGQFVMLIVIATILYSYNKPENVNVNVNVRCGFLSRNQVNNYSWEMGYVFHDILCDNTETVELPTYLRFRPQLG